MNFTLDYSGAGTPKRGDLVQTNCGDRRERTWFILRSHRTRTQPKGFPRFKLWLVRWWELEPEMRRRLHASAERNGGQLYIPTYRYKSKPKRKRVKPLPWQLLMC